MKISKSERINLALDQMGITNIDTLVHHLPRTYNDFSLTRETNLEHKERVVLYGRLVSNPTIIKKAKLTIIRFSFITNSFNYFKVVVFNRPYLYKTLNLSSYYTLVGTYDKDNATINLVNIVKGPIPDAEKYKAVYSLPSAIENYQFANMVKKYLFDENIDLPDIVPNYFRQKYQLLSHKDALKHVHAPKGPNDVHLGLRVLKYEECLIFTLQTQIIRRENKSLQNNEKKTIDTLKINEFIKELDYKLTHDQVVAVREIILDMNEPSLMYRLLQGDVGTGKTLVANIALFGAYLRGDQGALMAPTDALAHQHYETLTKLFKNKLKVGLLVGSMTNSEKKVVKEQLLNHEIDIIVGTHALFSNDVQYAQLGLVVIDEQHKFGVNQRLLLASKGENTDLLLMSATPIPRTLALTLYGDLDVSTISEYPVLNRNIETKVIKEDDKKVFKYIDESIRKNNRIFVVAPLIESGIRDNSVEDLYQRFYDKYQDKVVMLHGKLEQEEKNVALESFKNGETPILISTTVIEVGIDIKNADLMVIYSASNFGLASLHQIRGRIGRDGSKSTCLLLYKNEEEEDVDKLKILETTLDGFKIAEEDLAMRGPGDMNGLKQSGMPNFAYANIISDFKMFEIARDDATYILNNKGNIEFKKLIDQAYNFTKDNKFRNV
ncbi:MAG: ATP-dependent DNA helicase RecG [Erysipelotrichales bacterium]|nr:ATP-dependent DNA helicase RecG [Erysipelotrichales bacterium]